MIEEQSDVEADEPSLDTASSGGPIDAARRVWSAPLWAHAIALALVLLGVTLFLGTDMSFSSDEGAAIIQAQMLADGDGWIRPNPFPEVDPEGTRSLIALSEVSPDGIAPFGKHPTYPVILAGADRLGGVRAMVLLSVGGAVLAAWFGARISARFDPRLPRVALWALGIGSPLLFDSQLVIAHTLGAALTGGLVLALLRARERWAIGWILLAVAACFAASLLRTEAILFGIAVGLVVCWDGLRARSPRWLAVGACFPVAAVAAMVADRWLLARIITKSVTVVVPVEGSSFLEGRINSFGLTTIVPGSSWSTLALTGLMVALVAVVAGGLAARLEPRHLELLRIACLAAIVGWLLSLTGGSPDTVPGILVACPILAAGLVTFRRRFVADAAPGFALRITIVFIIGVLLLQYSQGGAAEWGARFLALALPLMIPLALLVLVRTGDALPARDRSRAGWTLVVGSLVMAVLAVWSLHYYQGNNRDAVRLTAEAARSTTGSDLGNGDERPIVVTSWAGLGRLMWPEIDSVRGLTPQPEELRGTLEHLHELGATELTLMTFDERQVEDAISGIYDVVRTYPPDQAQGPVYVLRAR